MIFYENIKEINNPDSIYVLVNKNNKLPSNFIPHNLELINKDYSNEKKYLRLEAKEAFENLCLEAKNNNFKITAASTYRPYEYQEKLYNNYVKEKGFEYAENCSARPGHSEHQTGLAVDVAGSIGTYDDFEKTKEFNWMLNNAYKYGFILRYPKGKEHITGFKYEPWHYRYVGFPLSLIIHNNNLTLEEYLKGR